MPRGCLHTLKLLHPAAAAEEFAALRSAVSETTRGATTGVAGGCDDAIFLMFELGSRGS
jgi:hypothetical protein